MSNIATAPVMRNRNAGAPLQPADDVAVHVKNMVWRHNDDQAYRLNLWCAGPVLADPSTEGAFRFMISGDCGDFDVVIRPNPTGRIV